MKNYKIRIMIVLALLALLSCNKANDPVPAPCTECTLTVTVDTTVSPGSWKDANDYWHVKLNGIKYFTMESYMSEVHNRYTVNDVPLVAVDWDSDYWIMFDSIGFKFKLFSPFGYVTGAGTRIPVGDTIITLKVQSQPTNIIGYVHSTNRTGGIETRYSSYARKQIIFTKEMVGDTAIVFTKGMWNTDYIGPTIEKVSQHCIIFEK